MKINFSTKKLQATGVKLLGEAESRMRLKYREEAEKVVLEGGSDGLDEEADAVREEEK